MFTPVLKLEHADERGELYSITLPGDQELLLLHSKEGSLRGGHAHTVDEIVVLLTGEMRYHKRTEGGEEYHLEVLQGGQSSFNERGLVHMGEFLDDTWLLEWKIDTHKGEWRNIDYPAWRERVKPHSAG